MKSWNTYIVNIDHNNSGSDEENNDSEDEDDEDDSQGGNIIATENRTNTYDTSFDTGDSTKTMWGQDRDPVTISRYIHSISRVIYTLTMDNLTRTFAHQCKPIVFLAQFQGC